MYGYEQVTPHDRYHNIQEQLDCMYDDLTLEVNKAQEAADKIQEDLWIMENKLSAAEERVDTAYSQRTIAAVAFAHTVLSLGGVAGVGLDDRKDQPDEWRVVLYVDTAAGQISWHIAPKDQAMLEGLPQYVGTWNGTYNSSDLTFYKRFIKPTE
jgi:hypothetical protein